MKCIYCGEEFELKSNRGLASKRKNCYKEECEKRRMRENIERYKAKNDNKAISKEQEKPNNKIKANGIDIIENDIPNTEINTKKVYELEITVNEIDYKDILDISCVLDRTIVRLKELRTEAIKKKPIIVTGNKTYYTN